MRLICSNVYFWNICTLAGGYPRVRWRDRFIYCKFYSFKKQIYASLRQVCLYRVKLSGNATFYEKKCLEIFQTFIFWFASDFNKNTTYWQKVSDFTLNLRIFARCCLRCFESVSFPYYGSSNYYSLFFRCNIKRLSSKSFDLS